jgi:hypothetical protein
MAEAGSVALPPRRHYDGRRMLRLVSALWVALALLVSPVVMAGTAHAAPPSMEMAGDHCADMGEAPQSDKSMPGMDIACAMACTALPAAAPDIAAAATLQPTAALAPRAGTLAGIHPESETPPPRILPEI